MEKNGRVNVKGKIQMAGRLWVCRGAVKWPNKPTTDGEAPVSGPSEHCQLIGFSLGLGKLNSCLAGCQKCEPGPARGCGQSRHDRKTLIAGESGELPIIWLVKRQTAPGEI